VADPAQKRGARLIADVERWEKQNCTGAMTNEQQTWWIVIRLLMALLVQSAAWKDK
jgi:hypothetical protein